MGYTEIWKIKSIERWQQVWPKLVADARTILEAADMDLTSDGVLDRYSASLCEVHATEEEAIQSLLYPPPPIVDESRGIVLNGIQEDGCEPLKWHFLSDCDVHRCKTNERPYTVVVQALLIRAKQLLGGAFSASLPDSFEPNGLSNPWAHAGYVIRTLWPNEALPTGCDFDDEYAPSTRSASDSEAVVATQGDLQNSLNSTEAEAHENCIAQAVQITSSGKLVPLILNWMQHCKISGGHEKCQKPLRTKLPRLMRLIDVERLRIVQAPPDAEYVALSYVWGSCEQVKLLEDNNGRLTQDHGFCNHGKALPKTISDAIVLCRHLGYRYLWIDALCIMQDSLQDKLLQLNSMRDVYSNSVLTIAAVWGKDSHAGLETPDSGVPVSQLPAIQMDNSEPPTEKSGIEEAFRAAVGQTIWSTRGWTFQEMCLSRRLLAFTQKGLFFHCGSCVYSEAGYEQLCPVSALRGAEVVSRPGCIFTIEPGHQLKTYLAMVQQYSTRQLTFESDEADAMKGILRAFGHVMDNRPNSFYDGIPTSAIDQLLCWRVAQHEPDKRREGFPSWSWYGWKQTPIFPEELWEEVESKKYYWGSRIMGYDGYRRPGGKEWGGTKLDSYGINSTGRVLPLMIRVRRAELQVAMQSVRDIGDTNGSFRVTSPVDGRFLGTVQLDKEWRRNEPPTMSFIPVYTTEEDGEAFITTLMCLRKVELELGMWGDYERVQIVSYWVGEEEWQGIMAKNGIEKRHIMIV